MNDPYQDKIIDLRTAAERISVTQPTMLRAVQLGIARGTVADRRESGPKGKYWITESELERLYPNGGRHRQGRRRRLTPDEVRAEFGVEVIVPGTPEWEAAKQRMKDRR